MNHLVVTCESSVLFIVIIKVLLLYIKLPFHFHIYNCNDLFSNYTFYTFFKWLDGVSATPRHDENERRRLIQQQNEAKRLTQVNKQYFYQLFYQIKTNRLIKITFLVSNGHSPANLVNSSTCQKFAKFLWLAPANLASIEQIFVTRSGEFGEYWANLANLAKLASLANLARID